MKSLLFFFAICTAAALYPYKGLAQQTVLDNSLYFVKNQGQILDSEGKTAAHIKYVAESDAVKLYFSNRGVSYVFTEMVNEEQEQSNRSGTKEHEVPAREQKFNVHRVDMLLVGSNPDAVIAAEEQAEYRCNYFQAHCPQGITQVPSYRKLVYRNVYDNIDMVFYQGERGIKYDFVVRPGGKVSDIRFRYSGADKVILSKGRLKVTTSLGEIEEQQPVTYQYPRGRVSKKHVDSRFYMANGEVRFDIGSYNADETLVVDPDIIWSTYFGGSGSEFCGPGRASALDGTGHIYVHGYTNSTNFPVSTSASQTTFGGGSSDAFIVKFSPDGRMLWATYFGGNGIEGLQSGSELMGGGLALDRDGNVLVTGLTTSTTLPGTTGAFQPTKAANEDAYIAKFNSIGVLQWTTFYGGNNQDWGLGIATDADNSVVICGMAASSDFPVSSGAYQTTPKSFWDAFVVKFSSSGQRLWATYLGGNTINTEQARSVTIDKNSNVIVAGYTGGGNFPTTGGFQTTYGGGFDGFVTKFSAGGSLIWSTFLGGSGNDNIQSVATDSKGNIIVTGSTQSSNFPVTSTTAIQSVHGNTSSSDGFIASFDSSGQRLWATYYGGSGADRTTCVNVDGMDNIIVAGYTESTNPSLTVDAYQSTYGGGGDGMILKLSDQGQKLWASYFGGTAFDYLSSAAIDRRGSIVVWGYTNSTNATTTVGAFQPQKAGPTSTYDGLLAKFGVCSVVEAVIVPKMPDSQCATGNSVLLDAGEHAAYRWSNGATSRYITVDQDGVFTVSVANEHGCTATSAPVTIDLP